MSPTVAVVGGGYGGIAVAKALDDVADVVLVEPRDRFVHNVAALRGLVDPQWTSQLFLPYDGLLSRGQVVRDRAARVDGATITLGSGQRLDADYTVLATGSSYPFPAKSDEDDSTTAIARMHATREVIDDARSILLLGAGPVGLELAGEIKAAWPDKRVTIVDPSDDILSGNFVEEFRAEVRRQLDELGIELILGTSLREDPPTDPGEAKTFTAVTRTGREIEADVWFRCYGVVPSASYLAGDLAAHRQPNGHVRVSPELRLPGSETIFALGDVTAVPEPKLAAAAGAHAEVVAANIRSLIAGDGTLRTYEGRPPGIALPLGPTGGASYLASMGGLLDSATTSELKGADLLVSRYAELLGVG